jgi:hypothetical protein
MAVYVGDSNKVDNVDDRSINVDGSAINYVPTNGLVTFLDPSNSYSYSNQPTTVNKVQNADDGYLNGGPVVNGYERRYGSYSSGYSVKQWAVANFAATSQPISVSVYMRSPTGNSTYLMYVYTGTGPDGGWYSAGSGSLTTEWQRYTYSTSGYGGTVQYFRIYRYNQTGTIDIACPQVELTTSPTEFTIENRGSAIKDIMHRSNAQIFGSPTNLDSYGGSIQFNTSSSCGVEDITDYDYFTSATWFTFNGAGNSDSILVNKEECWEARTNAGNISWAIYASNQGWFWQDSTADVTQGTPQLFVMSYDGNYVRSYLNGVLVQTYTYPAGGVLANQTTAYPKFNCRGVSFGHESVHAGNHTLHMWLIYSRALRDDEVEALYNSTKNRF